MDEHLCTNCGAALPRTGTYCLTCDTPVADAVPGLSVAPTEVVRYGRPVLAGSLMAGSILVVGLLGYGSVTLYQHHRNGAVAAAATDAVAAVVRAESGHAGACPDVTARVAGDQTTQRQACRAVVGEDPGARIKHLRATAVHRQGSNATALVQVTLVDHQGRHTFDDTVHLDQVEGVWRLAWDGQPFAP